MTPDIKTCGKIVVIDSPRRAQRLRVIPDGVTQKFLDKIPAMYARHLTACVDREWTDINLALSACPVCGGKSDRMKEAECDVCEGVGLLYSAELDESYDCPCCAGSGT